MQNFETWILINIDKKCSIKIGTQIDTDSDIGTLFLNDFTYKGSPQ